jgi:UDP-N-acetylmuramate: L-alanyl-gamma-D-glutamyl-meso-diaminopimelate ligase
MTPGKGKPQKLYFMGIGGTGMAAVAGLCQSYGYEVLGSDGGIYPPMSDLLSELEILVMTPYDPKNLEKSNPDKVVVANCLSRGNPEVELMLTNKIPYTSFPALLEELFLKHMTSIVVTGTHGKTTTTALIAHMLRELEADPSFMIGGLPKNFPRSFHLGKSELFVIEGDEYDTAFFDKGPKFLHYRPDFLILNNLEYDHADIYESLEQIVEQFCLLVELVKNPRHIIANIDDANIVRVLQSTNLLDHVTKVSVSGNKSADLYLKSYESKGSWSFQLVVKDIGELSGTSPLMGMYNLSNIAHATAVVLRLRESGFLAGITDEAIMGAIASFAGVARRMDHLFEKDGIDIFEDFAHHPTAVKSVIESFRRSYPDKRLIIAFEPRGASQRRNTFLDEYAKTLALADRVLIGECPVDKRIDEGRRMDTRVLEAMIGNKAKAFSTNSELGSYLASTLTSGDAVVFMSSGSFSGVQHQIAKNLTK